jgi:hypothetical protein
MPSLMWPLDTNSWYFSVLVLYQHDTLLVWRHCKTCAVSPPLRVFSFFIWHSTLVQVHYDISTARLPTVLKYVVLQTLSPWTSPAHTLHLVGPSHINTLCYSVPVTQILLAYLPSWSHSLSSCQLFHVPLCHYSAHSTHPCPLTGRWCTACKATKSWTVRCRMVCVV